MSDRDQPDEALTDAPAPGVTSGTEQSNGDRDDDLPSFDAYGDKENWSAFEDDESLGSDPEWTEDSDESSGDGALDEPWADDDADEPTPPEYTDDSDSLFDDEDFDDDNVSLSAADNENEIEDEEDALTDTKDGDDDENSASLDDDQDDEEDADDLAEDDDDDDYIPAATTPVRKASRTGAAGSKKTGWVWPTITAVLALSLIGTGGYGWFYSMEQSKEIRSLELQLRKAKKEAAETVPEPASSDQNRVAALEEELASAQRRYENEIAALEDENQTLEAKLASVERALVAARQENQQVAGAASTTADPAPAPAGSWFVNIQTFSKRSDADRLADTLSGGSESVTVQSAVVNGKTLYRVRAAGYASKGDATAAGNTLVSEFGISKPWIGQEK